MPTIRGGGILRDVAMIPCADEALRRRGRYRRDAIDLLERDDLLDAAFCYRIVALDEPPSHVLRAGGEALDALRLVPKSGQLTALGVGICTLGPALERRASALFAERRMSLALALDRLGNELLSALSRRVQDRIVSEARKVGLTAAGELRAGDPGLPLAAQTAVHRLAGADTIGVSVTQGQVLHPLKSMSMVLGIGIDLPAAHWSRCDDCPSAPRCRMSGRAVAPAMI
jgi:hypothetical protein